MSTMQAFHNMIASSPKGSNHHLDILAAITQADREQLKALSSDLIWQTWSAPTVEA